MADLTFAASLKQARESRHMTVQDLAYHADVSVSAVYLWEAGERLPSIAVAARVAKALGMTTSDLLGETKPPERPQDEMERLIGRLSGRQRKWALEVMRSAPDFTEDELRILLDLMRSMAAKSRSVDDGAGDTQSPEAEFGPRPTNGAQAPVQEVEQRPKPARKRATG